MIKIIGNIFNIETENTSYVFSVTEAKKLEHIYYGKKAEGITSDDALKEKNEFPKGSTISYSEEFDNICLEDMCLEVSSTGKGDIRDPFVVIKYEDGSSTSDFLYYDYEIAHKDDTMLPTSYGSEANDKLKIRLKERNKDVYLNLYYTAYPKCDVITRRATIINESGEEIKVERLMSLQLDLDEGEYDLTTFNGAWAREMDKHTVKCGPYMIVNSSKSGVSSSGHNPFVMLSQRNTTEDCGNVYGINLVYSGNHYESVQENRHGKTRLLSGMNPEGFSWILRNEETFDAPEAIMTYSDKGFSLMSINMHHFVNEHIIRGYWKYKERPVLNNSWEAAYFNFNQSKLIKMAKAAKDVGVELFVLDDGWFGNRNDDKTSLGDWYPNKKKLPGGIKGLSDKIKNLGLEFGIWVEPEMVNRESRLYKDHPEWAIENPNVDQSLGRNQLMLDLSNPKVRDYIFEEIKKVFSSGEISYVKWDMNRIISDAYSNHLDKEKQEELMHRYVLGLYEILGKLNEEFPKILFEACASGGNRFDLGMLCFMPQIWASDNTDALCRTEIQGGYSYGYPMSTVGAHVSDSPNHQTLRKTSLETRFQVACFGILGYEMNINELSKEDKDKVREQIKWYKKRRKTIQFGDFYRLKDDGRITSWMTKGESDAVGLVFQNLVKPNFNYQKFKAKGLKEDKYYRFTNRIIDTDIREFGSLINAVSPVHIKNESLLHDAVSKFMKMNGEKEDYMISGSSLNNIGIKLKAGFAGTGHNDDTRVFQDFASRIYMMEEARTYFSPGRVNLIGEHQDYNGGVVLPCAINLGIYGHFFKRDDDKIILYSRDFPEQGIVETDLNELSYREEHGWANYVKGVIDTLFKHGNKPNTGFNFYFEGNLPKGSGLSSSACIEVLTAYTLNAEFDFKLTGTEVAKLCKEAENKYIGVECGIMDQFAISMGKENNAVYLNAKTLDYEYVPIEFKGYELVIMNTNKERTLSESKFNQRFNECKEVLMYLKKEVDADNLADITPEVYEDKKNLITDELFVRRGRHVVTECQRTKAAKEALLKGDITKFGELLRESHKSLKYDYEVSGKELDTIVEAAELQEGVIGARMTGAGFGGCALALVKEEHTEDFKNKVREIYLEKIGYEPSFYEAKAVSGPKRIM